MTLAADRVRVALGGRVLLDDVSVTVAPGELVAVVGPNGAGKSTLLATLAGDRRPDAGTITLGGRELRDWDPAELARRRGVMVEDRPIAFAFTAADVVMLGRSPHHGGRPAASDEAIVSRLLAAVDGADLGGRVFAHLSTGERQRIQLARALAQVAATEADGGGRYLLLDEPTSSLDPAHQHVAMRLLREAAADGVGVLAVVHDLVLAATYADRIMVLDGGRSVALGGPGEALDADRLGTVFGVPMLLLEHPRTRRPIILADPATGPDRPRLSSDDSRAPMGNSE